MSLMPGFFPDVLFTKSNTKLVSLLSAYFDMPGFIFLELLAESEGLCSLS